MLHASLNRSARLEVMLNRFPLKTAWDMLALGQVLVQRNLTVWQKGRCVQFYLTGGHIRNLFPTLTRSGSHWSLLGIALATHLKHGHSTDYVFSNDSWVPSAGAIYTKLDWREPTGMWDSEIDPAIHGILQTKIMRENGVTPLVPAPAVFHTHLSYFRLRCARLRGMQTVVVLRSIYDSMESKYHKHRTLLRMGMTPLEFAQCGSGEHAPPPSEESEFYFPWDHLLADATEFFNSWGSALRWHPNIRQYRYEDLVADPVDAHKEITDFWNLDLPHECLKEAFAQITKTEMAKKLPTSNLDGTSRVADRKQGAALPPGRIKYIRHWLDKRLLYDFGYGTEWAKSP